MSKLVQSYAGMAGLAIGTPFIESRFFPLEDKPYVTIQGMSVNQNAKNYDYFNEVLDLLEPILTRNGVKIYQIGGKDEPALRHCHHLMGQTTIPQAYHVLRGSLCHISVDSYSVHVAAAMGRPVVGLYGNTSVKNHGPYWMNPNTTILIESHRNGKRPTYSQENPKTINTITPESVVNAVLKLLGANGQIPRQSLLIGPAYNVSMIELVPNFVASPEIAKGQPLLCRYDYTTPAHEDNVYQNLALRPLHIITDKPLKLEILKQLKANVNLITYEMNGTEDIAYIKALKRSGLKVRFLSRLTGEAISDLRLRYLDTTPIEYFSFKSIQNFYEDSERYLNSKLDPATTLTQDNGLWFRSNKFILSNGKVYLSKAHLTLDLPTDRFENNIMPLIDHPDFWCELDHYYVFRQRL